MIEGFESETHELTMEELNVVGFVVEALNQAFKGSPIKNQALRHIVFDHGGVYMEEPRMRKIINYISMKRLTVLPLVASSQGYFITSDQQEIKRYLTSLRQRADAILDRKNVIERWAACFA